MTPLNSVSTSPEKSSEKVSNFKNDLKKLGASVTLTAALLTGNPNPAQAQATEKKAIQTEQVEKLKTSDYITQAPAKLKQYYPEEEAYFQKIFEVIKNAWPEITKIANLKLEEQFNKYAEDFTDEKDRWTTVFMFCELGYPATEFTKRKEKLDEFDLDMRQVVATETLDAMKNHFLKENARAKEENARAKEENARAKEKLKQTQEKLKELQELWKKVNQQREQTIQGTERVMEEIDPQSVKTVAQVQEMVRYYEKICKENGRTPTKKAQELINQLPEKQKKK